jgi:hypothetical protein
LVISWFPFGIALHWIAAFMALKHGLPMLHGDRLAFLKAYSDMK